MLSELSPRLIVQLAVLLLFGNLCTDRAWAQAGAKTKGSSAPPATASGSREADRAAVREALQSFAKAFESRDASALAAHWTVDGEYTRGVGQTLQGRAALEKAFSEFFARTPDIKAEISPRSLRFLGHDAAIGEGLVKVRRGAAEAVTRANYRTLLVREEGRWQLAQLSESPIEQDSIEDLAWLIGQWKSASESGAEILTTYAWTPSKKFIRVDFTIKEKELALSGTQVIGVDPATGRLRSWTFEADGGVGQADWGRDGDHWTLDAAGTLADGRTLSETNILRRVSDDTFTWQSVDRWLDDAALADLAPVKVTRVKAQ